MNPTRWFFMMMAAALLAGAAHARDLTAAERAAVDAALAAQGLNEYGDPAGTVYVGTVPPLVDDLTGEALDRYEYVLRKHPALIFTEEERERFREPPNYAPPADRSSPPPAF